MLFKKKIKISSTPSKPDSQLILSATNKYFYLKQKILKRKSEKVELKVHFQTENAVVKYNVLGKTIRKGKTIF